MSRIGASKGFGSTSQPALDCTSSGSKRCHLHKMAALISKIFYLLFVAMGGSRDVPFFFINVNDCRKQKFENNFGIGCKRQWPNFSILYWQHCNTSSADTSWPVINCFSRKCCGSLFEKESAKPSASLSLLSHITPLRLKTKL